MTDPRSLQIIAAWLTQLSAVVRHNAERPTKAQVALYATLLAAEMPSGAFTPASLAAVAAEMSWWPDHASLRRAVLAWWNDHKPACAPRLTGPGHVALDPVEAGWVAFWHRRRGEIEAPGYLPRLATPRADLARLASLIRWQSPRAWQAIGAAADAAPERRSAA